MKGYLLQRKSKAMVFRKLRNLVSRKAQAAASNYTANTLPSSDDEQPEPTLVCSPCSLPTAVDIPVTVLTNKCHERKRQFSESEGDEVPISTDTDKNCKRRRQNPEFQDSPYSFELMINYFGKCFGGTEKSYNNHQIKT